LTLALTLAGYWRRIRLRTANRLTAAVSIQLPKWSSYTLRDKSLTIALGASVIAGLAILAVVASTPQPGEPFTACYSLCPDGHTNSLPTHLNVSQPGSVLLGLANHEFEMVNYTVRVDLVGVRIVNDSTAGTNETLEVNRTTLSWTNTTLPNGQSLTRAYTFAISNVGLWKIQFLLYEGGVLTTQKLQFFVRVS